MAGNEQKTAAPEKPKYDRNWLEHFIDFQKSCPKLSPLEYVQVRVSREEACDTAHKELSIVAEYMLKVKNGAIDGIPADDKTYASNDVFLNMTRDCGNRTCGGCIGRYLETKVVLERNSTAKGEEFFLSDEERREKHKREAGAETEKRIKEHEEARKASEKKE
jgi:hypothetical protein